MSKPTNSQGVPTKSDRRSERGELTRQKILDAAEHLFAEHGYHAVSLRDITVHAEVENALASYHFKTKDLLFRAVIERRASEHRRDMLDSLDEALRAARPSLPTNQALVKAYARPALEKIRRDAGWASYIKLIVSVQNLSQGDQASLLLNPFYDDTIRQFLAAFIKANPRVPVRRVHFALYFLHGTFIHVLSQGRAYERLIDEGNSLQDHEELLEELAELFAGGLNSRTEPTR